MTYLEFLKTLKSGTEINNFLHYVHFGCAQSMAETRDEATNVWKSHCLREKYRGHDGCKKCMSEFWDKEMPGKEEPKQIDPEQISLFD